MVVAIESMHIRYHTLWQTPIVGIAAIEFLCGALFWQIQGLPIPVSRASVVRLRLLVDRPTSLLLGLVFGSALVASRGWPPHGWIVLIPFIVVALASERGPRWLNAPGLQQLGKISYSLYLLHYPWQWLMNTVIPKGDIAGGHALLRFGVFLLYLVPPFPAALLCYRFIEMPFKRLLSAKRVPVSHQQSP